MWIGVNRDCVVEFRLTTKIKGQVANVEVNDNISLTAGGVSRVTFHDTFDYLNEDVLKVEEDDTIEQILEVITSTSEETTFTIYSNSIYPSKFYLNTQSMVVKTVQGTIGEQLILGADGVAEDGVYNFTVDSADDFIPYRKNGTKFLVDLALSIVGDLDLSRRVAITFGDTVYFVYNILKGNEPVTIGDLKQVDKYNNAVGYRFITEMLFFENADIKGFAIIPTISMSDVLSLTSDEMDSYMADGGLTQGQLAICNKVITNGYAEGGLYRFDITYPDTYTWTELSSGGGGLKIVNVNDTITTGDLTEVVNLTDEQYSELVEKGSIVVDGQTITFNDNTLYVTPDISKPNTLTFSGTSVLTSNEKFNNHVHIMVEFETDSIHAGFDCVLHPYDESVCFVTYNVLVNGTPNFATAYLNENGQVVINVPSGLTFTNVHGKYVVYGG